MDLLTLRKTLRKCQEDNCKNCLLCDEGAFCLDYLFFSIMDYTTDERIKLGVQCCNSSTKLNCNYCPYSKYRNQGFTCVDELLTEAMRNLEEV